MRYIETEDVQNLIGHDAIVAPASVEVVSEVVAIDGQDSHETQRIHMGVADVDKPDSIIIRGVQWSDYSRRDFESTRVGALAKFTNARVVNLDFPGMGERHTRNGMTARQMEEAGKGRLQSIATNYWRAIVQKDLLNHNGQNLPIVLWGSSLSTLTMAEMALAAPEDVVLSDLYLHESMALRRVGLAKLAAQFMLFGGKNMSDYKKMNQGAPHDGSRDLVGGLGADVVARPQAHYQSMKALAQGKQMAIIAEALRKGTLSKDAEHGTRIHHVTSEKGLVNTKAATIFADQLARLGVKPGKLQRRQVLMGEGHGIMDALPAVLDQARRLTIAE